MSLRTYWCVLSRLETTNIRRRIIFRPVDQFSCELDLDEGMGYTVRAAFLNGVRQLDGEEADTGQYRMDVYDTEDGQVLLAGFVVPPGSAMGEPAGPLAEYTDDELLAELAWRLKGEG